MVVAIRPDGGLRLTRVWYVLLREFAHGVVKTVLAARLIGRVELSEIYLSPRSVSLRRERVNGRDL